MLEYILGFMAIGGLPLLLILLSLEGNPITGFFIPGQVLAVFFGVLVASSEVYSLPLVLFVVFLGAFLGDCLGYLLGYYHGNKTLNFFKISKSSSLYSSSKKFFNTFGVFSIILGRQFNLTRAFIPFLAGICKLNKYKFFIFAFISNIIWTFISVFLGYYFGLIILNTIDFMFGFILFLVIYFILLKLLYNKFKSFDKKKSGIFEKYAVYNIFLSSITLILFVSFLFLNKTNFPLLLNNYFNFIPHFPQLFKLNIFFSYYFLFFGYIILFLSTFYFKNIKLLIIFIWSLITTFLLTFFLGVLFAGLFQIKLYYSLIFLTVFLFLSWILLREEIKTIKNRNIITYVIIFFMILFIIMKILVLSNVYLSFLSFFLGLLLCEFLVILSHYRIIDRKLSISCNIKS